ncbi:hypothetical protein D9M69_635850 [compost metagenome]
MCRIRRWRHPAFPGAMGTAIGASHRQCRRSSSSVLFGRRTARHADTRRCSRPLRAAPRPHLLAGRCRDWLLAAAVLQWRHRYRGNAAIYRGVRVHPPSNGFDRHRRCGPRQSPSTGIRTGAQFGKRGANSRPNDRCIYRLIRSWWRVLRSSMSLAD